LLPSNVSFIAIETAFTLLTYATRNKIKFTEGRYIMVNHHTTHMRIEDIMDTVIDPVREHIPTYITRWLCPYRGT